MQFFYAIIKNELCSAFFVESFITLKLNDPNTYFITVIVNNYFRGQLLLSLFHHIFVYNTVIVRL